MHTTVVRARRARLDFWDGLRLLLAVTAVLGYAVAFATYSKPVHLATLIQQVGNGRVSSVTISPGLEPGAVGFVTREVSWRSGVHRYRVTEQDVTPGHDDLPQPDDYTDVNAGPLEDRLRQLDPALRIAVDRHASVESRTTVLGPGHFSTVGYDNGDGIHVSLLGRSVSGWLVAPVALWFACFVALFFGGPAPLRYTRWGWLWIVTMLPAGGLVYLVFAGRTGRLSRPDPARVRNAWAALRWLLPTALAVAVLKDTLF